MNQSQDEDLNLLVRFLNWRGEKPAKKQPLYRLIDDIGQERADFDFGGITDGKLEEAANLRNEIAEDLDPIMVGAESSLLGHLDNLVDKINGLGLTPHLAIEWGHDMLVEAKFQFLSPFDSRMVAGSEKVITNPALRYLGTGQGKLRLKKTKLIVRERYLETNSVRKRLYWVIRAALKTGELGRVKKCRECHTYLVGAKKYCDDRCRYRFLNAKRSRNGYFQKNYKLRMKRKRVLKKKGLI